MASTNQVNVINNSAANQWRRYSVYKDSGVDWLGEIPGHWEVKRVKWITETHKQGYYTNQRYISKGVKLARITDIDDFANVSFKNMPFVEISAKYEELFKLQEGDFLFARSGTIGRFGLVKNPERSVFASYLIKFRFSNVDPKFLAFAFSSHFFKENLISTLHGGANQNVHAENIKEQLVPIPPLHEQKAIASFLDKETARIDALVAKKQRLLKLLKEKRTALISHAVTKGLDPTVAMKDSGVDWLGEIPGHWEVKRLKFITSEPLKYGANESADFDDPNSPRYIRITDITEEGSLRDDTFRSLPENVAKPYLLKTGDLLFARSGATVGKTFMYCESWGRACYAGYLIRARINLSEAIPEFISYFANSPQYWNWLSSIFIQATIQNVSGEKYGNLFVPIPPLHEQKAIASHLDQETLKLDNLIKKIRESIEKQKEYRTALISAAVTGKIDVSKN